MKITNRDLLDFNGSALGGKHLPTKLSFAIAVNAEEIEKKIKVYHEERIKLAEQYAEKDPDGNPVIVDDRYVINNQAEWDKAFKELQDTEVEVVITTVTLDDVAKCDDPRFDALTVYEMSLLKFMIEE